MKNNLPENYLIEKNDTHKDWLKVTNFLFPHSLYVGYWKYYGFVQGDSFFTNTISSDLKDVRLLTVDEFVELLGGEKTIDFSVKGTILPNVHGVEYRCVWWDSHRKSKVFSLSRPFVSFGITTYEGVKYVLAEESDYIAKNYFMIKLEIIEKIAKEQGMWSFNPKTHIIKREQLQEIHDIACAKWQHKIMDIARNTPFGDISLTQKQVDEMFGAATPEQLPILKKIFPNTIDLTGVKLKVSDDGRAFILPPNANWEITTYNGLLSLVPTFK